MAGLLPNIVVPEFPTVPLVAGVPVLARAKTIVGITLGVANAVEKVLTSSAAQNTLFESTQAAAVWGVFDADGNQVIDPDNIMAFDYHAEWAVADFPVQQGEFSSYDKVTRPYDTSVVLTKGGTTGDRTTFLLACETVAASLDLYTIFTPEQTYPGVNVTRMQMSRKEARGAFFVVVELFFRRINQTSPQYSTAGTQNTDTSNATTPTAVPNSNSGLVQPLAPTPQTVTAVQQKVFDTGM